MPRKSTVQNKSFDELLLDKYGDLYQLENKDELKELKFISTGSLALDSSIGRGGIPRGKVTFIYGKQGSFKTHLVLNTCKNAVIKEKLNVLFIDGEGGTDEELISDGFFKDVEHVVEGDVLDYRCIVDNNFLRVIKVRTFEQALETYEFAIQSGEYGMVALDSISANSPKEELEKELLENTVSIQARLLPKFFRRNIFDIARNQVAAVFIGQVRDKIGAYVPTEIPTGGHAILHFSTLEIHMRISTSKDDLIFEDGEFPVGGYPAFHIKKNKLGPPNRSHKIPMRYGVGIDSYRDLVEFSEYLGIIQKRGAGHYNYEEEKLGQGLPKVIEYIKSNAYIEQEIRQKVMKLLSSKSTLDIGEEV